MPEDSAAQDVAERLFKMKPGGNAGGEVIVGALRFRDLPKDVVKVTSVSWGNALLARLKIIVEMARETDKDEGYSLPYASLRAALHVRIPDPVYIDSECGAPWSEYPRPLFSSAGDRKDAVEAARLTVRTWVDLVLAPWAEKLDIDDDIIEAIRSALDESDAFIVKSGDLSGDDIDPADFKGVRDYILRTVSKTLVGTELFDGMGPVARIIRARADSNRLALQTWPKEVKGAAFSMVAELSLETTPEGGMPILLIRASRRRWVREMPKAGTLSYHRFRRLTPYLMTRDFPGVAVTTWVGLKNGDPEDILDPGCILHGLQSQYALPVGTLRDQVAATAGGTGDVFVGIPHATAFGGHPVGTGATYKDNIDIFERVRDALKPLGAEPVSFTLIDRIISRGTSGHEKMDTNLLFQHIAKAIGAGDGVDDVKAVLELLLERLPLETVNLKKEQEKAKEDLSVIRGANKARIEESYKNRPLLNVVAATAEERKALELAIECLFGDAVKIGSGYLLPAKAHGPRSDFPDLKNFNDRFTKRYEVWTPLAQEIGKQTNHGAHVLVQAAEFHPDGESGTVRDDRVCKAAGRTAFAREANSNSQWLKPYEGGGEDEFKGYLYRVQAAVYDLLLGHAGCVDPIDGALLETFEDEDRSPECIIGISVVSLARQKRGGGRGGKIVVAFKITPGSRATLARAVWKDGRDYDGDHWRPLNEFLTHIAGYPGLTIGATREEERTVFQKFVKDVIDESADNGEKPLIIIDATNARDLWPTLKNTDLTGQLEFHALPDGIVDGVAWRDVRIVRVDRTAAGVVAQKKVRGYQELDPGEDWQEKGAEIDIPAGTSGRELVKIEEWLGGGLYWASGGREAVLKRLRSDRSVYRDLANMIGVKKERLEEQFGSAPKHAVYRLSAKDNAALRDDAQMPSTLEIAVIKTAIDDDEDRVAELVDSLRRGYGHHGNVTALPAPLSFDRKVQDYIARFTLKDQEPEEPDPNDGNDPDPVEADEPEDEDVEDDEEDIQALDESKMTRSFLSKMKSSTILENLTNLGLYDFKVPSDGYDNNPSATGASPGAKSMTEQEPGESREESEIVIDAVRLDRLPSFVDEEWVRTYVYLTDKLKNAARMHADHIAILTGFTGWPRDKSAHGKNKSLQYVLEGLHYPNFMPTLYQVCSETFRLRNNEEKFQEYVADIITPVAEELFSVVDFNDSRFDDPEGSWEELATEYAIDNGRTDLALTFSFHNAAVVVGAQDIQGVVGVLERNRDAFENQGDLDIVINYIKARAEADQSMDNTREAFMKWRSEHADKVAKIDEELPPRERWNRAVTFLRGVLERAEGPDGETVEVIQDAVNDLREILDEVEAETVVDMTSFRHRLENCRDRLVELAAHRMQEEWKSIAASVDKLPSALDGGYDSAAMESNVGDVEESMEAVEEAEEARKTAHHIEGEHAHEEAVFEALTKLRATLDVAFRHLFEAVEYIESQRTEEAEAEPEIEDVPQSESEEYDDAESLDAFEDDPEEDEAAIQEISEPVADEPETVEHVVWVDDEPEENEADDEEEAIDALPDPKVEKINNRLRELFSRSEFGFAYHLAVSAGLTYPAARFDFTEHELLLTACANFTMPSSFSDTDAFNMTLEAVLDVANDLEQEAVNDITTARRICLFASTIELALFQGLTNPTALSIAEKLKNGAGSAFFDLFDAAHENMRFGSKLSASALYSMASKDDKDYAADLVASINAKLDVLENNLRHYKVGRQVQNWLIKKGPLGEIRDIINGGGDAVKRARQAKAIASTYLDESAADQLIEKAEDEEQVYQPVVHDGRKWFKHYITDICDMTVQWTDVVIKTTPTSGESQQIERLSGMIAKGVKSARDGLEELRTKHGELVEGAVQMAENTLNRLEGLTAGTESPKTNPDRAMVALHAPLLWVPRLSYAGEWIPTPYHPDVIVSAIMDGKLVYRDQRHDPEVLAKAIQDRIQEGSFIAARLLLSAAPFYVGDDVEHAEIEKKIDHELKSRKEIVSEEIEETGVAVINSQRYTISNNDTLQTAYDTLEQAKETLKGEGCNIGEGVAPMAIFDIKEMISDRDEMRDIISIENIISDIRAQIDANYEHEKYPIIDKLEELKDSLSAEEYAKAERDLKNLVDEEKDLATALELIDHYNKSGDRYHRGIRNPDSFNEFFFELDVPDILERNKNYDIDEIAAAISEGADYKGIPFSRIEDREWAADIISCWKDFRHAVHQPNTSPQGVIALAGSLLEVAGFHGVQVTPDKKVKSSGGNKKEFLSNLKVEVPRDSESILLPDFGSSTNGEWRLVICQKLPNKETIERLTSDASNFGVMILLPRAVSKHDWEKTAVDNIKNARKVIIVDEGIFIYALSKERYRALTMIEIAQAFSFAEPYKDHLNSAMYPEMFKGRRDEYRMLQSRDSAFLVYGGRRLGKTALLRYFAAEENKKTNVACACIDVYHDTDPKEILSHGSDELKDVFNSPTDDPKRFSARIRSWLDEDPRRQIYLMVDECDEVIKTDETKDFPIIKSLVQLMGATERRFKLILAGRQNILRLRKNMENAPLTHMDSGVLPIGPMINKDVPDAETLMTAPLAGLGFTFKEDKDVWRILSYCNYYPVMIQHVGEAMVRLIRDRVRRDSEVVREIDGDLVTEVLNLPDTITRISQSFSKTLELDGQRYELLTYIVAERMLEETDAGIQEEGMRAPEILEAAALYWPAAFGGDTTVDTVNGLLEEMEVLGLLRKASSPDRWTLRSRSTLSFIGGRHQVSNGIVKFVGKPSPAYLENTSKRRLVAESGRRPAGMPRRSVLTIGQEANIIQNKSTRPLIIWGHEIANISLVQELLRRLETESLSFTTLKATSQQAFRNELANIRTTGEANEQRILLVPPERDWDNGWVSQATRARIVQNGVVKVVFIGGPDKAAAWCRIAKDARTEVDTVSLQPWRKSFISSILQYGLVNDPDQRTNELYEITGGWSRLIETAITDKSTNKGVEESIPKLRKRVETDREDLIKAMGLEKDWGSAVRQIVQLGVRTDDDVNACLQLAEDDDLVSISPEIVMEYLQTLGHMEHAPATKDDLRAGKTRRFNINPLVVALFSESDG